jgi:hypothetical protein
MRTSPPITPDAVDWDIYIVLEDFGLLGQAWRRENDDTETDRETLIGDLLEG